MSHAVCVRGLKLLASVLVLYRAGVARRVRAWIETHLLGLEIVQLMSHAVCVRGLKQPPCLIDPYTIQRRTPCACVD